MPTIFLTGATGYIGGHALQLIAKQHPEWEIITLVRNKAQEELLRKHFHCVRTVVGSLEDLDLVGNCAAEADVVLQLASSSHPTSSTRMINSMARRNKGTFIQMSGICALQNHPHGYGKPSDIIYNDSDQDKFATSFSSSSPELSVLSAGKHNDVSASILCSGLIYGIGKGPGRRRGTTVPYLMEATLKRGKRFMIGEGTNVMSCIHIDDVASALLVLTEHALARQSRDSYLPDTCSLEPLPFYFLGSNTISMNDLTKEIVKIAQSRSILSLDSPTIEQLSPGQAAQIHPWAPMLWGSNCVGEAKQLEELRWQPEGPSLIEALPEMLDFEISLLAGRDEDLLCAWQTDVKIRREEIVSCF
ncbi:hypothetical protein ONS95_008982 [Cadophora gregata]|uniref:uncharacterized protein n=1 Tax=Cadophora gregata TaxID=51156 RepID=UPI0026DCC068|nr:uncharacterized protein ONS95_008982 [Cadophora gregata]KAK0123993.1 hypothetical protein ONS95_008982 [Cadophora gregata]KAK0130332.1 hypothetical protein ONS96_000854 [Cadophora gregata f. sp. sojae]